MTATTDIDAIRRHGILSSLAGFPILLVFGFVWIAAGALSYLLPGTLAPWSYVFLGGPAMPIAIALEKRLGYLSAPDPDPLFPLAMQLLFVQIVAFPAILLVWDKAPHFMPVAFAAIVGAHFLPYMWVYCTPIYGYLAVAVAVGPYGLAVVSGAEALHYTGFLVGVVLLVGAVLVRAHARRTWDAAGRPQR